MPVTAFQPRDATLSALAGLSWSSGVQVPQFTAADVASLLTVGTGASNLVQLTAASKLPAVDGSLLTGLAASGKVAQVVSTFGSAVLTGTTTIPLDDTIPQQSTEGTLFYSRSITPTNASSNLLIIPVMQHSVASGFTSVFAVFVDSTANAIWAAADIVGVTGFPNVMVSPFLIAAESTSARTYKIHGGPASSDTLTINGVGGARRFGGVMSSGLLIAEILP